MKQNLWLTLVTCLAYCVDEKFWKAIDYLKEQVRASKRQQEKDKRILLNNHPRVRLPAKARRGTRKLFQETSVLFAPDTVLGWYLKLIAQTYDGNKSSKNAGRLKISQGIIDPMVWFKQENPRVCLPANLLVSASSDACAGTQTCALR